ncbi:MAG TPA: hypothetical protein VHB48_05035 [Chitinophagaceae bacterium]|nr:hypothetical protein [Chitinophagaceae bacterium]
MKKILTFCIIAAVCLLSYYNSSAQNPVNWTPAQLMQPATLAQSITSHKDVPVIICIGPGAVIPGSVNAGPAHEAPGMAAFKKILDTLPKNAAVVVYCGCCPFEHCPNVRPAIAALKEAGFTNYKLLNLEHNIRTDWIDKGYPKM